MKTLLNELLGKKREHSSDVDFDAWFKALASVLHHISHLSPTLRFDEFCRHAADALCHGLAPLNPVAAHFRIDVCTSHLWLPDASFKLDSFFRMQNRILMNSQTRPVETSRDEFYKTICCIPYELHRQAIEIVVYHSEDPIPDRKIIEPVLEGYVKAVTRALQQREDHLLKKMEWETQVEKVIGSRLAEAIHQVNSPLLYAQTLRSLKLSSPKDSNEHIFLSNLPPSETYRATLIRLNKKKQNESSSPRFIALISSLAAQLRFIESNIQHTSFTEYVHHFSQSLQSLTHLLTFQDDISLLLIEYTQKTGVIKWHNAGFPPPMIVGKAADSLAIPVTTQIKPFSLNTTHDWQTYQSMPLPSSTGFLFFTDSVLKRLSEIHLSAGNFFERLRGSTNAAQLVIEAEKLLSTPDSSRVVSGSVSDWNSMSYDLTLLGVFNVGSKVYSET